VVEVNGPIHKQQKIEDVERTRALLKRGLKIIRFNNEEIMNNLDHVLQQIENELGSIPIGT